MFKQHLRQVLLISSGARGRSEKHSPIVVCPTANTYGLLATLPWPKWRAQTSHGTASVAYGKSEQRSERKICFGGVGLFDRKGQLKWEKNQRMREDTAVVEAADTCIWARKLNEIHNPECRKLEWENRGGVNRPSNGINRKQLSAKARTSTPAQVIITLSQF